MIGRSLTERSSLGALAPERAASVMRALLASHAKPLVEVRSRDARMIACAVVRADKPAVRLCRALGFDVKPGGTCVFGLLGDDAARLFTELPDAAHLLSAPRRAWLEAPCSAREMKVLLVAGGLALLSITTTGGNVTIEAAPEEA